MMLYKTIIGAVALLLVGHAAGFLAGAAAQGAVATHPWAEVNCVECIADAHIQPASLTGDKIRDNSLSSPEFADGSLTGSDIADNYFSRGDFIDNDITQSKLDRTYLKKSLCRWVQGTQPACSPGEQVVGGGCKCTQPDTISISSRSTTGDGWDCQCRIGGASGGSSVAGAGSVACCGG